MKKLSFTSYRGIEFIELSALSPTMAASLKHTLNERTLIKILVDDAVLNDCVLYSAYEKWYANYNEEIQVALINDPKPSFGEPVPVV